MKQLLIAIAVLLFIYTLFWGWRANLKYGDESKSASVKYYTEIPGITDGEIQAVEKLKAQRDSFLYGHIIETDSFKLPDGTFAGFTIEVSKLLSELFGIEFEPCYCSDWEYLKGGLDNRRIDFTGVLAPTPDRREKYFMTAPITGRKISIYTLEGSPEIINETQLNGLKLGFLSETMLLGLINERYVDLDYELVTVYGFQDAAEMLQAGDIDVFVADSTMEPEFDDYSYIKSKPFFSLVYIPVSITTANPELAPIISVIDKYLLAGGIENFYELDRIGRHEYSKSKLFRSFTEEELSYIDEHVSSNTKIDIGMQFGSYPASFYNEIDEEFQGIAIDILEGVTQLTGLEFEPLSISRETSFSDILETLRAGKISMIAHLVYTEARKYDFFWGSVPYLTSHYALLSRSDYPDLDIFQVSREKVGMVRGTAYESMFESWFENHPYRKTYNSSYAGFDALESGEIDLLMLSDSMLLQQTNLREKSGFKVNIRFSELVVSVFGFANDEKILKSIVDKSMLYIDCENISSNWLTRVFDYSKKLEGQRVVFFAIFTIVLFVALLIVLALFFRNKLLGKELVERQRELSVALSDAEVASQAKSAFLANMSHEIRTPMNGIIGFSEIAVDSSVPLEEKDNYLRKINQGAMGLLQIINDILDISKIEAGKVELESIPIDLAEIINNCKTIITPLATEKGIDLRCYAEPFEEKTPLGDPTKLRQIILNLLSNAVKFTNTGYVSFSTAIESFSENSVTVKFEVEDSGIGMSDKYLDQIFDPFSQADGSTTRRYGGTGLGLPITKNLVEMMGGELLVVSKLGRGSKFSFVLTFDALDAAENIKQKAASIDENVRPVFKGEVLICEDNEINQQVLKEHLHRVGMSCVIANNGLEGVNIVKLRIENNEKPFDLIFMDIHMPIMDGLEAADKLYALGNETPIVALTANIMFEERKVYEAHHIPNFLGKPFTSKELWRCLYKYFTPVTSSALGEKKTATEEQAMAEEEALRIKLLKGFVKNNKTTASDISEAINAGDIKLAHRLAHTLSGLAALVKKDMLRQSARGIEVSLANNDIEGAKNQIEILDSELNAALDEFSRFLDSLPMEEEKAPVQDKEMALKIFEGLEPALRSDSTMSLDFINDLKEIPDTETLISQIEDYEFETALQTLLSLKKTWEAC